MSILIGLLASVLSFVIGFFLKASAKLIEAEIKKREKIKKRKEKEQKKKQVKKSADIVRKKADKNKKSSKADKDNKKKNKFANLTDKALKLALKSISAIRSFLKTLTTVTWLMISFLISLSATGVITVLLTVVLLVCVISSVSSNLGSGSSYYTTSSSNSDSKTGYVSNPIDASVKEIIDMSETEVWQLISEGRFKSYDEANKAAQNDAEGEKKFWTDLLATVECPVWQWKDSSKTEKVSGTIKITVNKHLAEYFKSFLTDIYSQPNKYVIYSAGGFNFRTKNNGTGTSNLSAHSFGTVLDINPQTDGMGSNAVSSFGSGIPWNSDQGLSEPYRSESCAFNGNWYNVAKKYRLDWGGLWSTRFLDPMHFSIVGDTNRDSRTFKPKSSGQDPK